MAVKLEFKYSFSWNLRNAHWMGNLTGWKVIFFIEKECMEKLQIKWKRKEDRKKELTEELYCWNQVQEKYNATI